MYTPAKYGTAESRWAGVGPYYAMFPTSFADKVIAEYSKPGNVVLDPLAGRGTSVFSAFSHDRIGIGIEINPVGWVYGKTKLKPAAHLAVRKKLTEIYQLSPRFRSDAARLPHFFHECFAPRVLRFLLAARSSLDWRHRSVDRTAMALILINLHGKREDSLSNQMRQTKAMSPPYASRWWAQRKMKPPDIDPLQFMLKRAEWRYAKGCPTGRHSYFLLGDCTRKMRAVAELMHERKLGKIDLLFTSPPYYRITNYHYDQWLRLWVLGGTTRPKRLNGPYCGKFANSEKYEHLLRTVFTKSASLLSPTAIVYVRTDSREATYIATSRILREVFPRWNIERRLRPVVRPTQTQLFRNSASKNAEIDLIVSRH